LQGRAIVGVVDGFKPKGIETTDDVDERKKISTEYWLQVLKTLLSTLNSKASSVFIRINSHQQGLLKVHNLIGQ
jgi:hypothetical protein